MCGLGISYGLMGFFWAPQADCISLTDNRASETFWEQPPRNTTTVQCGFYGIRRDLRELADPWSSVGIKATHTENVSTMGTLLTTKGRRVISEMELFPGVRFI